MTSTRRQIEMPDSWTDDLAAEAAFKTKFPRAVVDEVLDELYRAFDPEPALGRPYARCLRMCAVGGYRRRKAEMKDLELLFIPRVTKVPNPADLFGAEVETNVTEQLFDDMQRGGVLAKRLKCTGALSAWGQWNKHAVHVATGLPIDFFATPAEWYFNRLVVTTGPRESNVKIATLAREKGFEWEAGAGGFVPKGGKWETSERTRMTMRSEREVFAFVDLPCLRPEERR